jgi:DNA-binding LacI/PurR family transcriptional regulator
VPVTIKDIARKAEVSHSTVSRALNGSPLIAAETVERIRKTASQLGYMRSAAARTLKTNRSQVLGVIISNVDDPFFSEILQGIEEVAQASGYSLFMAASQRDPEHERSIIRTMREHRVDGIILCSTPFSAEQSRQLCSYGIPIIVINNQSDEEYRYSIEHDDLDGARQVTRHLIGLGHRRIAYIGFPRSGRTNLKRLSGYREEMRAAGLKLPADYEYEAPASDPQTGRAAAAHFKSLAECPSAIFCYNDMLAIGVLQGFQQSGLQVPHDCSLAGFDNITYSAYTNPPLTTFDQPKRFIGAEAARLTLRLLDGSVDGRGSDLETRTLQGRLLVRGSTAAPAR